MKILAPILINLILAFLLQLVLPWWVIILITAISGYFFKNGVAVSFVIGFFSIFLIWSGYSLYLSALNDHLLAQKVGEIFQGIGANALFVVSGVVGGIFGGLGSLLGYTLRKITQKL